MTSAEPAAAPPPERTPESFKTVEQAAWSLAAADYARTLGRTASQAGPHLLLAVEARAGEALLDVCCGPGLLAGAAEALGLEVVAIDFAPAMIAQARARFARVEFRIGDAEALDVRESAFDAAICNFGLGHLADPAQAMREVKRALRPGGRYAWTVWRGVEATPVLRTALEVAAAHGVAPAPPDRAAPPRLDRFRLAAPAAAERAMSEAGFVDVAARPLDLVAAVEPAQALDWARLLAPELGAALTGRPPEAIARLAGALAEALTPLARDDGRGPRVIAPAPALLCVGRKPGRDERREASEPKRGPALGMVRRLLGSADPAAGAGAG